MSKYFLPVAHLSSSSMSRAPIKRITDSRFGKIRITRSRRLIAEKDSILLYHELLQRARDSRVKDMLSKLLEEEKMHLVELREQYEEMS